MIIETIFKNLRWLGHDAFLLKVGDKNIYFDPYEIPDRLPGADIILISHEHYDHCSLGDIKKIQTKNTVFVTESDSAKKLTGKIISLTPWEETEVAGLPITAVPAYNLNKKFHPKANGWLGFVITIGGVKIYHAGDTDLIPEMMKIKADIALLPVSGTYVMTPKEAARAARDIKPTIAVPMHCGSLVGTMEQAQEFRLALKKTAIRVEIL